MEGDTGGVVTRPIQRSGSPEQEPLPEEAVPVTATPAPAPPAAPSGGRWLVPLAVCLVYTAIAIAAYLPTLPLNGSHTQICTCGDTAQEVWFLAWVPFALSHAHSLFFSNWILYPTGVNLADNTSMPLLGLIGAPFTLWFGPIAAYNLILRAGFVVSGMAMFFTVRRFTGWWPAAFVAGLLYGFSPFMVGQGLSHEFLVFEPIPPLVLGVVHDMLTTRRRTARRNGFYLGLLFGLQYLISSEIFLMMLLLSVIGCALSLLYRGIRTRERLVYLGKSAPFAALTCAVLIAYPVWFFLRGPRHIVGPPHPSRNLLAFHGDLVGAVVPTPLMQFGTHALLHLGKRLTAGNVLENGLYLGVLLVALAIALVIAYRRVPLMAVAGVLAAISYALSLGPHIALTTKETAVPGPFDLLVHLPLIQDVETARFSLFTVLFVAVVLGVGLARLKDAKFPRGPRSPTARSVLVVCLGLVVLVPLAPRWPYVAGTDSAPAFFSSTAVKQIPTGSVVVTYPYPEEKYNQALAWQAVASMRFRLLGGTTFFLPGRHRHSFEDSFPPPSLDPSGIEQVFEDALLGPKRFHRVTPPSRQVMYRKIQEDLVKYHVRTIIIDPAYRNWLWAAGYVADAIGKTPESIGGVLVWFDLNPAQFPKFPVSAK